MTKKTQHSFQINTVPQSNSYLIITNLSLLTMLSHKKKNNKGGNGLNNELGIKSSLLRSRFLPTMVVHVYNPSYSRRLKHEDNKFKASLGNVARFYCRKSDKGWEGRSGVQNLTSIML